MTEVSITVATAETDAIDRVEALLKANELPYRDVRAKPGCFFVAVDGTEFIGVGGIERYESDGLLRSVVTKQSVRGRGYGSAVCDELEAHARKNGIATLYLLTTTAAEFFRQRGYEAIDREEAPSEIRETTEFTDLCPSSATCMKKSLR
ncbi:arsenic resistance N-acetyltransferase ArsN2 [Natrinema sp. 1APR25-10V2]|uniref:arsenic resistance N-acetyltransferase ArsN2 n=1 Tax=Natrinema sp. 1APR25-10V2 TaxID=2951081 RepID=UPI0028770322|nr:arsenic resistance N-acetyltransferase ArsN2 [Natrinema sp. 1APR25-10V2]MDS0474077.1 arsenic resistance N-acetyltransferase ArsN2 [Natrinema sp. 1APR25-10V2]